MFVRATFSGRLQLADDHGWREATANGSPLPAELPAASRSIGAVGDVGVVAITGWDM
jgi:hypothetical protein